MTKQIKIVDIHKMKKSEHKSSKTIPTEEQISYFFQNKFSPSKFKHKNISM